MKDATKRQKAAADEIGGIVVEHLEDGEVTVVGAEELLYPSRAQKVLYVSPDVESVPE